MAAVGARRAPSACQRNSMRSVAGLRRHCPTTICVQRRAFDAANVLRSARTWTACAEKSKDVLYNHDPPPSSACCARARTRPGHGSTPAPPYCDEQRRPSNTRAPVTGVRCLLANLRVTRKSAPSDLGARRPTYQRAASVSIPGASFAERSASRRTRHLSPLVQLLSNWGKPRSLK